MTAPAKPSRPLRAPLDHFDADERAALKLGLLAVVAEHPGAYSRTRLSAAFAHMPDACRDDDMRAVTMPRPLPSPMPSGRALLELIDEMVAEGTIATTASTRPTLHLTKRGFQCLTAA